MTGDPPGWGVYEQRPVGTNAGDDAARRLRANAAESEVAMRVARELVVGERTSGASRGPERRNDGGKHVDALDAERETGAVEADRRAYIDADADGNPVEP